MSDENTKIESENKPLENPNVQEAQALIDAKKTIDDLKAENASLKEAKSQFYDKVINNNGTVDEEPKFRDTKVIRGELIKATEEGCTNLEYAKLAVELDDATIASGGPSVFLPKGTGITPTVDEYATAEKMNKVLKECIENSEGDSNIFNMQLEAHMPRRNK